MKRIIKANKLISLLLVVIITLPILCSCAAADQVGDLAGSSDSNDSIFDESNRPTVEQIMSIEEGTSFYDAVELLGKPKSSRNVFNYKEKFIWLATDGKQYIIQFVKKNDYVNNSGMTKPEYLNYFYSQGKPQLDEWYESIKDYYDSELSHQPTEFQMQKIQENMEFDEIVEIIGKPHSGYPCALSSIRGEVWITTNGKPYVIIFSSGKSTKNPFVDYSLLDDEVFMSDISYKNPVALYVSITAITAIVVIAAITVAAVIKRRKRKAADAPIENDEITDSEQ